MTFVFSVESGRFEAMAVLAIESLRRFGGRLADAPVIAVTSRLGPPLARATRSRFEELDVTHVWRPHLRRAWFPWIGKIRTVVDAERMAATETIAYIDCDVLFLGDAPAFCLPPDIDVAAGYPDNGVVGTTGPESRYETAWRRACEAVGMSIDDLPWVELGDGSGRIRFYLNAGIFVFRRGSGLPQEWHACTEQLFERRADFGVWREQFHEQVSLGLAILRSRYAFLPLPYSHNFGIDTSMPGALRSPKLKAAQVLHYHDQLDPGNWNATLARLHDTHPEVAGWLTTRGPIIDPSSHAARRLAGLLGRTRLVGRRGYRFPGWVRRRRRRALLLGGVEDE